MRKKKNKNSKNKRMISAIILTFILILAMISGTIYVKNKEILKNEELRLTEIKESYNEKIITLKDTTIYTLKNDEYIKNGKVGKDIILNLDKEESDYNNGYFLVNDFRDDLDELYYVYYKDVQKTEEIINYNNRYKKYLSYNKNIVTKDKFTLYDENNNIIYSFNNSKEFPIIINKDNFYGVEFAKRLLYIKTEDIKEFKEQNNSSEKNTSGISVLNYHFVYNNNVDTCNQSICHTETQFKSHLEHIKNNNIFTPTLKELEMYIDGIIQLPKSVVITIDDGWHSIEAANLLNQYELNGTVFLITSEYDKNSIESKYVEVHSHTHNMHKPGDCPTGQGGGLQCLSEEYIQNDLKKSREKLNNTTYLCYPFYEYNSYTIFQLKKAGFTMAFAGYYANGVKKATPGIDKFQVPRYVISNTTTVNQLKNMIG